MVYAIIGDISRVETLSTLPELTSDSENCRPELSDRVGRPRASAFQTDEVNLFFDHIYSAQYDTTPQRYLTSFAITREFFRNFFGTTEDNLDQYTTLLLPRIDHHKRREDGIGAHSAQSPYEVPDNHATLGLSPSEPRVLEVSEVL